MSRAKVTKTWAEVALLVVSLANVLGFIRVFEDFTFVPVLATTAISAHLLAVGCRRVGWGTILSAIVSAGGLALIGPLLLARDTTWYGLPTGLTWTTIRLDLARRVGSVRGRESPGASRGRLPRGGAHRGVDRGVDR